MPWNFFITPANYWELKLGTNSQSAGNFSSNEFSNTTGMFLKKCRECYSVQLSVYQNIWVKIKFCTKLTVYFSSNRSSLNK